MRITKHQKRQLNRTLMETLNIYSPSKKENPMIEYVIAKLSTLNPTLLMQDSYGNVHASFKKGNGDTVVHLNAHLDTVKNTIEDKRIINHGGIIRAFDNKAQQTVLGADDRAGVAAILTILDSISGFDGTIKVSFYKEEEIGCVGSTNSDLDFVKDVDLSITMDRHGSSDIVVGTWGAPFCCNEVGDWLEALSKQNGMDYTPVKGGISDALTLSGKGINSINLSVGYYNEHTSKEELVVSELRRSFLFAMMIIRDLHSVKQCFQIVPKESKWIEAEYWNNNSKSYGGTYTYQRTSPIAYYSEQLDAVVVDDGVEYVDLFSVKEIDDLIKSLQRAKEQFIDNKKYKAVVKK